MKFTTKALIVAFIIALSSSSLFGSSNSRILRRKKADDAGCKTLLGKGPIDTKENIYPGDTQTQNPAAKASADLQTKASRAMFYVFPQAVKDVIKNVSTNYMKMMDANKKDTQTDPFNLFGQIQRQTGEAGTWQVFNAFKESHNIDENAFHGDVVARLELGNNVTAPDILGFMGFLGDLGACLQDSINRPLSQTDQANPEKVNEFTIKKRIGGVLVGFFGDDLKTKSTKFWTAYSPDNYYDKSGIKDVLGKKAERFTCADSNNKMKLDKRAGVLGVGKDVDAQIEVTVENKKQSASKLKAEAQLPAVGWPWQTVPAKLVNFCPGEPWAGHFSGSLYELILMLELFDRADPKTASDPTVSKKKVYAAMAAAFLMATGMHSAVELVYVVKNYTGVSSFTPDKIMSVDVCNNASIDLAKLINELR